jgi:anti-sigma factor RsiW
MSDYLDGDLDPSRRKRMERHLSECDGCRRLQDGLRQTLDALHRLSGTGGGADALQIAAAVRERLDEPD